MSCRFSVPQCVTERPEYETDVYAAYRVVKLDAAVRKSGGDQKKDQLEKIPAQARSQLGCTAGSASPTHVGDLLARVCSPRFVGNGAKLC